MASKALSSSAKPLTFQVLDQIEGQFCNEEVVVRLLHFWKARNLKKENVPMGVEVLLLDSESNAVQRFISANRLFRHEDSRNRNSVISFKEVGTIKENGVASLYGFAFLSKISCFATTLCAAAANQYTQNMRPKV